MNNQKQNEREWVSEMYAIANNLPMSAFEYDIKVDEEGREISIPLHRKKVTA